MKIAFAVSSLFLLGITSCENDKSSWGEEQGFVADTIVIINYFDETKFESDSLPLLLHEIGICQPNSESGLSSDCSPRNFKFFKYNNSKPWNEGFGLEIRATVDDFPLRRFILFERVQGKLVKSRGFVANLAEIHTTPSGFNDLMLLFPDREAGSFVVKFVYSLEDETYEFKSLEAIDGYPVKKERKDSLSNVVLQRLTENNMFF